MQRQTKSIMLSIILFKRPIYMIVCLTMALFVRTREVSTELCP